MALKRTGQGVMLDSEKPHLVGINEDLLSTGITLYDLKVEHSKMILSKSKLYLDLRREKLQLEATTQAKVIYTLIDK